MITDRIGKLIQQYAMLLGIAGMIVALDQWSKFLVRSNLTIGETWVPIETLARYLRIVHWQNTGAAFGILPSGGAVFTVIAIVVSVAIVYYYPRIPNANILLRLALALQLGGAIGNLLSRLGQGTVTDFVAVWRLPIFNVADASITVGVVLLIASMWLDESQARREKKAEETGEAKSFEQADPNQETG